MFVISMIASMVSIDPSANRGSEHGDSPYGRLGKPLQSCLSQSHQAAYSDRRTSRDGARVTALNVETPWCGAPLRLSSPGILGIAVPNHNYLSNKVQRERLIRVGEL